MILLLALLCAAPEKVVIVARPQERPGFFHVLGAAVGKAVHRLYEKDDPDVDEGNSLAAQNDPEGALRAYDRALERLPDSPRLHYNRANQHLKLGSDHAERALKESTEALQTQDKTLKARASFDVALSHEELGNPDEAIKAYQETLTLDPDDADSKVNLELLLKQEERKQQQQRSQQQESKQKNQQKDQQPDKSKGEQQQKDQQKQAGEKKEEKKEQAGEQQQAQPKEERKEQQAGEQKPVDRSEAERLLDALRAGEKNLQVWRFAKDKRKEARRGDVERDW
jgi:tetratricopeptide (TPR) repeat protein